jgi:hypothetical protein
MNLIEPVALTEPAAQRISVDAEPKAIKQGFDMIRRLHKEGYVAEFKLGTKEMADAGWKLDVRSKIPLFVLTDQVGKRRFEAQTVAEVLALLKR